MSKKTFLLLLAIAFALAAVVATKMLGDKNTKDTTHTLSLPEYDSVSRIEITDSQDSATLIRRENEWEIDGKLADKKKVQNIWDEMDKLQTNGPVARNPKLHAQFQTDEQNATAVSFFTKGKEPALKILLGKRTTRFSGQYIRFAGEDTVWELEKNVGFLVPANPSLWYDLSLVSLSPSEISSISFSFPSGTFTLSKKGKSEEGSELWTLSLREEKQDIKQEDLMDFFFALNPLRADRFADEREQKEFRNKNPLYTIIITNATEETIQLNMKKIENEKFIVAIDSRPNDLFVLNGSSIKPIISLPDIPSF